MQNYNVIWKQICNPSDNIPIEAQLNLFQWMIETGWKYRGADGNGVFEALYHTPYKKSQKYHAVYGFSDYHDIHPILLTAFEVATKDVITSVAVRTWRRNYSIGPQQPDKELPLLDSQYNCGWDELHTLFGFAHRHLQVQLNKKHPDATLVSYIRLTPSNEGWQIVLYYVIPNATEQWQLHVLPIRTRSIARAVSLATQRISKWCS